MTTKKRIPAPWKASRGLAALISIFFSVPWVLGAAVGAPAPAPPQTARLTEGLPAAKAVQVGRLLEAARSRLGIPGLTASISLGPERIWSKGLGKADLENDVPATERTLYRLASVSKTVTAVAVLQLSSAGKLELDAPIQKYVPSFPVKRWPITARELLAHQSGLRHWTAEEWTNTEHYSSLGQALAVIKDDPLLFEPGTQSSYSSIGYTVLGSAVEGASGVGYLAYLRERVFTPAGMTGARDDDARAIIPRRAAGYAKDGDGRLRNSAFSDTSGKLPAGGLLASAPDMARFGGALLGGKLLDEAAFARMCTAQTLRDGKTVSTGLGLRVTEYRSQVECWQQGAQPKVSGLLYLRPKHRIAIALFCNLEGVPEGLLALARQVADIVTAEGPAR